MKEVVDEVLAGEPRYRISRASTGEILFDDILLEMITPVVTEGTYHDKALFDSIKDDFDDPYHHIPSGFIGMWHGSVVPAGWYLCNGQNGTPDLRNRFIVGSGDEYSIGDTGGEKEHILTIDEMPSHNHSFTKYGTESNGGSYVVSATDSGIRGTQNTANKGGGEAHENRPPYYALAFIMKA